jgi:hypothetical protein
MTEFVLVNISTVIHWQLACEASKHAVQGKKIDLEYETPEGDVTMSVQRKSGQVVIRRKKCAKR